VKTIESMKQEAINKRNEAIALFMGMEKKLEPDYFDAKIIRVFFYSMGHPGIERDDRLTKFQWQPTELAYNWDWSWIMPVVEKITSLKYDDGDNIYPRTFGMTHDQGGSYLFRLNRCELVGSESFIESVFIGISDFCFNQINLNLR
jgi:hypothetical protein